MTTCTGPRYRNANLAKRAASALGTWANIAYFTYWCDNCHQWHITTDAALAHEMRLRASARFKGESK